MAQVGVSSNISKLQGMLGGGLYSSPYSFLCEICQNATDSMRRAGKSNEYVILSLSSWKPEDTLKYSPGGDYKFKLSIRDKGVSFKNKEEYIKYCCTILESDKTQTKKGEETEEMGGKGIGCISPAAYNENTIKEWWYEVYKDKKYFLSRVWEKEYEGLFHEEGEEKITEEEDGVCFTLGIRDRDSLLDMIENILRKLPYFQNIFYDLDFEVLEELKDRYYKLQGRNISIYNQERIKYSEIISNEKLEIHKFPFMTISTLNTDYETHIVIDQYKYSIQKEDQVHVALPLDLPIAINIGLDEVDISSTRENIIKNDKFYKVLEKRSKEALEYLYDSLKKYYWEKPYEENEYSVEWSDGEYDKLREWKKKDSEREEVRNYADFIDNINIRSSGDKMDNPWGLNNLLGGYTLLTYKNVLEICNNSGEDIFSLFRKPKDLENVYALPQILNRKTRFSLRDCVCAQWKLNRWMKRKASNTYLNISPIEFLRGRIQLFKQDRTLRSIHSKTLLKMSKIRFITILPDNEIFLREEIYKKYVDNYPELSSELLKEGLDEVLDYIEGGILTWQELESWIPPKEKEKESKKTTISKGDNQIRLKVARRPERGESLFVTDNSYEDPQKISRDRINYLYVVCKTAQEQKDKTSIITWGIDFCNALWSYKKPRKKVDLHPIWKMVILNKKDSDMIKDNPKFINLEFPPEESGVEGDTLLKFLKKIKYPLTKMKVNTWLEENSDLVDTSYIEFIRDNMRMDLAQDLETLKEARVTSYRIVENFTDEVYEELFKLMDKYQLWAGEFYDPLRRVKETFEKMEYIKELSKLSPGELNTLSKTKVVQLACKYSRDRIDWKHYTHG